MMNMHTDVRVKKVTSPTLRGYEVIEVRPLLTLENRHMIQQSQVGVFMYYQIPLSNFQGHLQCIEARITITSWEIQGHKSFKLNWIEK